MSNLKTVALDYIGKTWAIGSVEVSDNPDETGRREENVMFGMFAVRECFRYWNPIAPGEPPKPALPPQERFLLVVRAIAATISGRYRDEALERAILDDWFSHFGLGEFARLMGQPEHADALDLAHVANHIAKHSGKDEARKFVQAVTRKEETDADNQD